MYFPRTLLVSRSWTTLGKKRSFHPPLRTCLRFVAARGIRNYHSLPTRVGVLELSARAFCHKLHRKASLVGS